MSKIDLKIKLLFTLGFGLCFAGGFIAGRTSPTSVFLENPPNSRNEDEMVFATFKGGQIKGKEVLDILQSEMIGLKKALQDNKKRVTLERARQHLLEIESQNRKMTADQLLADFRLQHQDDPVAPEELSKYIANQGLKENKITPIMRSNFLKVIKATKIMAIQNEFSDSLFKAGNVQLTIPDSAETARH